MTVQFAKGVVLAILHIYKPATKQYNITHITN